MEFIRGVYNLKSCHRGCVLTIGNFDGFHRGHQDLIYKLKTVGRVLDLPVMAIIFEPYPKEYFFGSCIRLSRLRDKVKYFSSSGIDILLCIVFNSQFSLIDPYSFVSDFLVKKLDIRLLCIGDNFRFGSYRRGNFNFLRKMSFKFGFKLMKIDTYTDNSGRRISSTSIRNALKNDNLVKAEMLLGHVYSISGRVVYGAKLGSVIGFPTLNISLKGKKLPINGVYAVKVYGIVSNKSVLGVANIGVCPTLYKCKYFQQRFEVHLLDYEMDLYGCYVEVVICAKIRSERLFSSLEELKYQINTDISSVQQFFVNEKRKNCF